jgi:hypothetical protein
LLLSPKALRPVRFELGIADRRDVAETNHLDSHRLITYPHGFTQVASVGDAHF